MGSGTGTGRARLAQSRHVARLRQALQALGGLKRLLVRSEAGAALGRARNVGLQVQQHAAEGSAGREWGPRLGSSCR